MQRHLSLSLTLAVGGLLLFATAARPQGYSADEAASKMTLADGFIVKLVAAEPIVRQPVAIEHDDRGRLWVIQYLQYPNPSGLRRIKVDRYSRTVYDRVPEPPPHGPKGADRLTILDDLDEKGRARKGKDFVNGLNLASGLAFGHGGVYVLQAPYLLFYPDRNGDDVPDEAPDVLLKGFGLEDAHSVANSLTWGPDGWLYGCQGSTVTGRIGDVEFQQGVWRFHPLTRRFELFCEGGGNSWGLDFDRHGNLLYSTNVGGFTMLHGVQGAYYWKSFGKHGELHNPFAYGYFDHVPHRNFQGGHVTVGGVVYQGDSFPERFRGKYLAADLLGHGVYWHDLAADGSSFRSAHGGALLRANDTWFAPSDVTLGPDGSLYVADWHDQRMAHPDPDAEWDRRNGRVYRIEARGSKTAAVPDLTKLSSDQVVGLLAHRNDWFRRRARRVLADRRDPEVTFPLRRLVLESKDQELALQALWALYVSGGFTESFAEKLFDHASADVRRWTIRLLGDERQVSPEVARRLTKRAAEDDSVVVRSQLASTARRLPAKDGLPIAWTLIERDLDGADPHLPLLLWWAVEEHCVKAREATLQRANGRAALQSRLARQVILPRLVRRYAALGSEVGLSACARLLETAAETDRPGLVIALDQGLSTPVKTVPQELGKRLTAEGTPMALRVLARLGDSDAQQRVLRLAMESRSPQRLLMIQTLAETGQNGAAGRLLELVQSKEPEAVVLAVLEGLQRFDDESIATALLKQYPRMSAPLQARSIELLVSRKSWAAAFLAEVEAGRFSIKEVPVDRVRPVELHRDRDLDALVRKHWGSVKAATPGEKLAQVRRLNNDLRAGKGDAVAGRRLFQQHCAACHRLFGEGENVGPDLTHANRKDRDYLLVSAVDPGAVVRKEYLTFVVHTSDGRVLSGLIAEQSAEAVTLLDAKNQRVRVPRGRIDSIEESQTSLMPEGLLEHLTPQQLRDLFSYLQGEPPLPERPR